MPEFIIHSVVHSFEEGLLSVPILFLAYLFMELLERSRRLDENTLRAYSGKFGPAIGGVLGAVPQCGISGAAASLFSTGAITAGTMMAVFFATSDEMLPIMLSSMAGDDGIPAGQIAAIVAAKAGLGIVLGYLVDAFGSGIFKRNKDIHSFCEREHCECDDEEGSVWLAALKHTVKITIMLIVVNIALHIILELGGEALLEASMLSTPVLSQLLLAVVGLIPNCAVSVVITEAYLSGLVSLGGLFAGLLSNAGIGLLVLLRTNRDIKENMAVIIISVILSALVGIAIEFMI